MKDYFIPNVKRSANRYDGHALVSDMYPQQRSPLWRFHSNGLLIRAATPPIGDYTFVEKEIFYPKKDEVIELDLIANVSHQKMRRNAAGERINPRRIHLFSHRTYDIELWLYQRSVLHGFEILNLEQTAQKEKIQRKGSTFDINVTHFQGVVRVTDEALLTQAINRGLSPLKAFGVGHLLAVPISS